MKPTPKKYDKANSILHLKRLRERSNNTQEDIADVLTIGRTAYNNYENGRRELKPDMLCALADYFKTTTDFILGRTEDSGISKHLPACDELGLSDEATAKLKSWAESDPEKNRVISLLVCHERFSDFVECVIQSSLSRCFVDGSFLRKEVDTTDRMNIFPGYALIKAEDDCEYEVFAASNILRAVISDIYSIVGLHYLSLLEGEKNGMD